MDYIHFFQWNVPAENNTYGRTNDYINIIAKWESDRFFSDGRAMVFPSLVNCSFGDCMKVKDWHKAYDDITVICENHFANIAKQEKINQARAILAVEENPILTRYEGNNAITY